MNAPSAKSGPRKRAIRPSSIVTAPIGSMLIRYGFPFEFGLSRAHDRSVEDSSQFVIRAWGTVPPEWLATTLR